MILVEEVLVGGESATGIRIGLGKAPLLLVKLKKGFVGCGYFNPEALEKLSDRACIVKGVESFGDVLSAKIVYASTEAKKLGVVEGDSGENALKKMSAE